MIDIAPFLPDLSVMLLGLALGYLTGLIPGIGLVILLLVSYPMLITWDLFHLLLFYMSAASAAQFSGSVIATTMGIPGESSSLPAVKEGNAMFYSGRGHFAISSAAMGSAVGAFLACGGVILILPLAVDVILEYYSYQMQLALVTIASGIIIFMQGHSWIQNFGVFLLGMFLASIGWNDIPHGIMYQSWFPYDYLPDSVKFGLPFFPVVVALFVIPVLWQSWNIEQEMKINDSRYKDPDGILVHIKEFVKNITSALRGTAIGVVGGLIPHVGVPLATNVSYGIEKSMGKRAGTYNTKGDIKSLTSAETANNAAVFMQLMPLVLLGIPITTSEAILVSIIERTSYGLTLEQTVQSGMFTTLVMFFIAVNVICFLLSWPLVKFVTWIGQVPLKYVFGLTIAILVFLVYWQGNREMEGMYYIGTFLALAPLGWLLRRTEPIILVIGFVLQAKFFESFVVFWQIATA
jgi:putative tricarboxylic transport membrane protein